jgi:hypothetical protein
MEGFDKLEYIGCDLKKVPNGRWLLLAKFKGSSGYYDWAPKWAAELDKLYATGYLVELLNGGHTLKGFKQIYETLNQDMTEALDKAEAEARDIDKQDIERIRQSWRQIIEQAPEDTRRTPAVAILRSAATQPVAVEGDTLVLSFRYPLHKEHMEQPENRQIAERVISNFLGHPCHIRCVCEPENTDLVRAAFKLGAEIAEDKG